MKQVVLISGKQGSGKSTLTNELMRLLNGTHGTAAQEIRFAGPIYEIHDFARQRLKELGVEIPDSVKVKDGPLLQYLGTEWGRKTIADDVWVQCARGAVKTFHNALGFLAGRTVAIVSDCRFRNEFDAFPEALRVRLECPKSARQQRAEMWRNNDTHPSEIDLDDYVYQGKFDLIFNTDTQSVNQCATLILAQLDKDCWVEKRKCL